MQREIKFRQPVYNKDDSFSHFHYWGWISDGNFVAPLSMAHNVKEEFGQQFTGLKDKNGVEIYESSIFIMGDKEIKYLVEWHDCGLKGKQIGTIGSYVGLDFHQRRIEVIGDKYQNPELLESK